MGRYRTRCASLLGFLSLPKRPFNVVLLKAFLKFRGAVAEEFHKSYANRLPFIAEPSRLYKMRQLLSDLFRQIDIDGLHSNSLLYCTPRASHFSPLLGWAKKKLQPPMLAYGAKLWSACSLLPLLPAPACWRRVHSTGVPSVRGGLGRDGQGTRGGSELPPEKAAASCTHSKASRRAPSFSPSRLGRSIAWRLTRKDGFENPSKTPIATSMSRTAFDCMIAHVLYGRRDSNELAA